ncbi:SPOR domain-containing protein [Brachybacterium aquaticum]|uniref:SPOR domain-containing protein n=1 Tax=Brachybacterium aquaticum TaxID=1432564 RepID=A0A841ADX9_9MICO|nr:SPOR domain-containing protein [Brachybacterium aquaticum]MBB5831354.1 hypothetical protein [Brachybacterium aquaticum]
MNEGTQYYYNLTTGAVEEGPQSSMSDLMGPYASREEAQKALATAAKRNEKWDQDDASWEGEAD